MPTLVEIVSYDPSWPAQFEERDRNLRSLLGSCLSAIDHIGSTAVPGLSAKPILDIDVTLRHQDDIAPASDVLVAAGYVHRGNRYDDGMWAFLLRTSLPPCRVYICMAGNDVHAKRIIFRDYLRGHDATARAYEVLKRELATQNRYDGDRYTSAKSAFIDEVVRRASDAD